MISRGARDRRPNTYSLVGPGGLLGLQRKVHASYDEFFHFRQAYEWTVADLGLCKVGTAICHDSDFFESWRILALKGASEEVKAKILKNMSQRARALILEEMEVMGPTRLKNTEEAQQKIVNTIRQLEEMGEIVVSRGGEEEVFV